MSNMSSKWGESGDSQKIKSNEYYKLPENLAIFRALVQRWPPMNKYGRGRKNMRGDLEL